LEQRIGGRRGDASDATVAVVRHQQQYEIGPLHWARIDAGGKLEQVAAQVWPLLK
jgi:predicted kinase